MACSATHPAPDVLAPLGSPWCSAMNCRSWLEPALGPAREGHLHVLTEGLDDLGDLELPVEPCLRGELQIGAMTTPSKVLFGDTKLRNRFSAHHLHGRLRPVGHIQRPQNPLRKARPPSEDRTTKDKPMDNPPPNLLGRLNRASEERKLRRAEYGRELLAATLAAKRAVLKAQRSRHAAEDAYSSRACKVLNRSTIVVHNVGEIAALMELLGEAQPPYGLRTVEVRGPVTVGHAVDPVVQRMRENLEANGFELREGNSYALPQKVVPQKVDQQGNQRWNEEEEEEEEEDEWEDDDYDDDEWDDDE